MVLKSEKKTNLQKKLQTKWLPVKINTSLSLGPRDVPFNPRTKHIEESFVQEILLYYKTKWGDSFASALLLISKGINTLLRFY